MRGWKRNGAVRHWPGAGKRDGSSSPSASRTNTPERKTPQASLEFPRHARITRGAEIQRIVREGRRIRTTYLEVRAAASPLARQPGAQTRIGVVVPRYKHSAVARNRLKRRLRELTRVRLLPVDLSADVVLRVRPEAYDATFDGLASDIERTLAQLIRWWPMQDSASPPTEHEP